MQMDKNVDRVFSALMKDRPKNVQTIVEEFSLSKFSVINILNGTIRHTKSEPESCQKCENPRKSKMFPAAKSGKMQTIFFEQ